MFSATAGIPLDSVQVLDRHVELVAVRVLQLHVLALTLPVGDSAHGEEAADSVIAMYHHVAGLELEAEVCDIDPGPGSVPKSTSSAGLGPSHGAQQG